MAQGKYLMALAVVASISLFMVGFYAMEYGDDKSDEGELDPETNVADTPSNEDLEGSLFLRMLASPISVDVDVLTTDCSS